MQAKIHVKGKKKKKKKTSFVALRDCYLVLWSMRLYSLLEH